MTLSDFAYNALIAAFILSFIWWLAALVRMRKK